MLSPETFVEEIALRALDPALHVADQVLRARALRIAHAYRRAIDAFAPRS